MALASFFDKAALSAAALLRGFNRSAFEQKLIGVNVGIIFENHAAKDSEQHVAIELLINLLARLYPTLSLICSDSGDILDEMRSLALRINPQIEIRTECVGLSAAVATVDSPLLDAVRDQCPVVYLGSNGWIAKVGTIGAMDWGRSQNTLGAAAAACLGAANVFRHIFRDQISDPKLDENLALSLFDYSTDPIQEDQPMLAPANLSGTTLIGAGAIGNAVIWALRRLSGVSGNLNVVDHESIELSNLQRYVLTDTNSVGLCKVNVVEQAMIDRELTVLTFAKKWSDHMECSDWNLPRLAVAVDTIQERINIRGALAKEVLNAWTQADEVGISRHYKYGDEACLSCLYFPDGRVPNEADLVGQAVGLPQENVLIRDLLQTGKPVDHSFLERVATALGIPAKEIFAFEGKGLRQFYSEAICGGMVFRLGATANTGTEVPMAFQSALAGIFLAAEILMAASRTRSQAIPNTTRLRVSAAVSGSLLTPVAVVERCICQDPDFRSVYQMKHGPINKT